MKKFWLFLLILIFHFGLGGQKCISSTHTFALPNKASAIILLPRYFNTKKYYPLLIALHGMGESPESALNAWRSVAERLSIILLCPVGSDFKEGYLRAPMDDRQNLLLFRDWMLRRYRISRQEIYLAGFSRGGNFAIESGLLYPGKFAKIICIYGFFTDEALAIFNYVSKKYPGIYRKSRFFFISAKEDLTYESLAQGRIFFRDNNVRSYLHLYKDIFHAYPPDLLRRFQVIRRWML